jgi:excisionase family DNA binding protein
MDLLTVKETAEMLRVSTVTVRRYIASGKLAAVRVGRNIRIRREEAESVIESDAGTNAIEGIEGKHLAEARAPYSPTGKTGSDQDDDALSDTNEDPARYLMEHYSPERQGKVPTRSKFADKSDEWLLENRPLFKMLGLGSDREGKTDIAENHDKYLAEAYADMHEDDDIPFTNPDGDTTLTPREWLLKNDPLWWTFPGGAHEGEPEYIEQYEALMAESRAKNWGTGKPLTFDNPIWDLVGMIDDDGPTDYSTNLDRYLVEAIMDNHEE